MNVISNIQLGSSSVENGVSLRVHRTVGALAGLCEIVVPTPVEIDAQPGDDVSVTLGSADNSETVFTGGLDAIEFRGSYTVFRALDTRVAAARMRVNQLFEEQTSDAIINDLAGMAGLDIGTLSSGITILLYMVDHSRNILSHLGHLAELGGAHLFIDRSGSLQTVAYDSSSSSFDFKYGEHILSIGASTRQSGGSVEIRTEGAASSDGAEAAFWPTTDTAGVAGTADGDGPLLKLWRPELRSMEDATTLATSLAQKRLHNTQRVTLTCIGLPEIELGDGATISDVPGTSGSLSTRVVAIEHRLNPWDGFITSVAMEGVIS